MDAWTREALELFGYGGVFLLMLIEDIVVPLPSEVIMPAAGFLAERAGLSLAGVVLAGTAGSLVGGLPWYYLGRALAAGRVPRWVSRRTDAHRAALTTANRWFAVHGSLAVVLARILPGIRSLIGIPAGLAGISLSRFLLYSAAGTVVWCGGLAFLGSVVGADAGVVAARLGTAGAVLGAAGLAGAAWLGWRRRIRLSGSGPVTPPTESKA